MNFRKYIKISMGVLLLISGVLIALGVSVWSRYVYTAIIYMATGAIQFLGSVFLYPRIGRLDDLHEVGNRAVQQNWIVLSIGITGMALFLAPFFTEGMGEIPVFAFFLCTASVLLSIVNIYTAVKKVNARLIV